MSIYNDNFNFHATIPKVEQLRSATRSLTSGVGHEDRKNRHHDDLSHCGCVRMVPVRESADHSPEDRLLLGVRMRLRLDCMFLRMVQERMAKFRD